MNILVRAPVEGEALGPAKTEPPVNVIVGGTVVMGEDGEENKKKKECFVHSQMAGKILFL